MSRKENEKLLSELGFSGKDLDIVADAIELHKDGMPMIKLYESMGRKRGCCTSQIADRLGKAISKAWFRKKAMMIELFEVCVLCRPPKNKAFLLRVKKYIKEKALISAATDTSAVDAEAPKE